MSEQEKEPILSFAEKLDALIAAKAGNSNLYSITDAKEIARDPQLERIFELYASALKNLAAVREDSDLQQLYKQLETTVDEIMNLISSAESKSNKTENVQNYIAWARNAIGGLGAMDTIQTASELKEEMDFLFKEYLKGVAV